MSLIETNQVEDYFLSNDDILYEFDCDHISGFEEKLDKILMIPTGESRISTKENPILFTSALAQCIALYVYSNNSAFNYLYHVYTRG